MEASSAINQPHPDADEKDVEDFFGAGDEPAPEDPGEVDAEAQPMDTRTDLERHEEAYQYAKDHGEPISEELEAFHSEYLASVADDEPEQPEPTDETQARLRAIAEREAKEKAEAEAASIEHGHKVGAQPEGHKVGAQPDGHKVGAEHEEQAPAAIPADPPATDAEGKQSGTIEREYIVFQKITLSERVLKHLLEQIEKGEQPRIAHFELHRSVARNDKTAVTAAYNEHKAKLGEKCDLAAVSSRSFKERHVEIKPVQETQLAIS